MQGVKELKRQSKACKSHTERKVPDQKDTFGVLEEIPTTNQPCFSSLGRLAGQEVVAKIQTMILSTPLTLVSTDRRAPCHKSLHIITQWCYYSIVDEGAQLTNACKEGTECHKQWAAHV